MLNNLFMKQETPEDLADYVKRTRKEKELSLNDVVRRAKERGHRISNGYVSQIENRYYISLTTGKLAALAAGLGVPEEEIYAVARGKPISEEGPLKELRLLEYFRMLTPERQDDLLAYAEMMSLRSSAMERAKSLKLPISSAFSQGLKRSSKRRTG